MYEILLLIIVVLVLCLGVSNNTAHQWKLRCAIANQQVRELWLQRGELQAIADEFERRLNQQDQRRLYVRSDLKMKFKTTKKVIVLTLPGYTDDGHRILIVVSGHHRPTLIRAINALVVNANCEC